MKRMLFYCSCAVTAFMLTAHCSYAAELDDFESTVSGNEFSDNYVDLDSDQDFDDLQFNEFSDNYVDLDSDQDFDDLQFDDSDSQFDYDMFSDFIDFYSSYNSYNGNIPEPYLSYLKYCLSWSGLSDNYVAFSTSYYFNNNNYVYYVIAIGDISYNGSSFIGSDVDVYSFYPNVTSYSGGNYRHELQSSFSYFPSNYLCFTDITSNYPDLRGQETKYIFVILCIIGLVIVFYTVTKFGFGNVHIRRRSGRPIF